ncbi:PAS domain-containing protein [Hymenobacter sp. BT188]|uniref:PAS domain-containing sensor histidine kinase n=1 Tax=Hymenobacter sp. BT188 TaxID=2763504 RepID=UPI00165150BA|nr:PAS domain-containing protein [Hymenobacter sp. BT188]MBC6605654.1 PAS domain-containing protein [Hymenobacter sp. BT188]
MLHSDTVPSSLLPGLHDLQPLDELLRGVLDVSLTGLIIYRPVYDSDGSSVVDFAFAYVNPAAQRMLSLPEQPALTHLQQWPRSQAYGTFAFHLNAFESGEPVQHDVQYQADGYQNYYRLAARRAGQSLLVSLTDTPDQPRTLIEVAEAQADVQRQGQQLQRLFMEAPAAICILSGPDFVFELVNPGYQRLLPGRQLLGLPFVEAVPELANHSSVEVFRQIYQTGVTHEELGILVPVARPDGVMEDRYFNYIQQARRNERGQIDGVLVFAFEVTEQFRARQQAEALQAELRAAAERREQASKTIYQVFEHTPAAICIQRGPEHRYEYINAAYQAFFPDRQLLGLSVAQALPETVEAGVVDLLDNVYQTGETYFGRELPLLIAQPDGRPPKQMYFTFTYQAYRENGEIVGISTFAYNVADQVLARQRREAQQRQLDQLFMQAPTPIVILDGPEMVYQLVNPAYQQIFPGRDLLDKPLLEALPELADTLIPDTLKQVYQTGKTYVAHELPLLLARYKDAPMEEIYWNFTFQARHNGPGGIDGVFVFAQDVTAQVRARRMVEEREESFRLMADNAPAMLWVTDPEGYCTYLNQPWYTFTGQTTAEALGMGWVGAIHPDDAAAAGTAFIEANAQRAPYHKLFRLKRHDGVYRWVTDSGLPRFSEAGEFEGMVGTVIDVHEQKLAELALQRLTKKLRTSRDEAHALNTELRTANDQLTRTNVDLDNFIYTASHDLKAPITNIEGLVHVLAGELPANARSGEVDYILELMQSAVDRFKSTINHLTDVSKLQKEHGQAISQVMLAEVVEDVRLDLAPLLQEADAQLKVDVLRCPVVAFSEKNLRSVVYNLLSNALKYRHPDRPAQVSLHCHAEETYVVMKVQDNGLGIDLSRERQLFQMFQRFHTHVEGSGVGLYMVKKMVENAGGKIEVESEVGVGSTFTVYFRR